MYVIISHAGFIVNLHSVVCLNVKKLLARSRHYIWSLGDSNRIRTYNHLVRKQTLNHLAKLALIQFMGHGSGRKYGNSTNDPIFSSTFYTLIACEIISEFEKNSKFMSCLWSILACKVPQFLARSYQFGQLIILFQKVDTMRLLKIYIIFCPPITAKYSFF